MSDEKLDPRQERALSIVRSEMARRIRQVAGSRWLVPSQSSNAGGGYVVDADAQTCSCPDHEERGAKCKHI
jgi:hypothetical protein